MKKLITITILFISSIWFASAEIAWTMSESTTPSINLLDSSNPVGKVYKNSADFLEAEWKTCEVATDGCNTIQINNGKLWASTMMYCEDILGEKWQEKWSCKKQIEKEESFICTMEYTPVCWVDAKTYGNSCMAQKVWVAYAWECNEFVDKDQYKKLEKYTTNIKAKIKTISKDKLEKAIVKLDKMIEVTKLQRIAKTVQIERITKNYFIKQIILNELNSR